ncbi:tricarballylate dehydrogenase [Rhodobacter sp. TJ_12]|uniref:FAD-dependent tricarballylate dehydrogenase TcuA n=1 Tax=Rhodobacter sp. TJ_12 TaxID=2029399 RepID=UPI001D8A237C|nr:FAD-dependent tricarballylate dehydrogenase TcuA [Rhodobacter sp. TJ_12]MBZ4021622.1 tricarballylate dehydrogenase [Rhodobacter sp. TJ_12]
MTAMPVPPDLPNDVSVLVIGAGLAGLCAAIAARAAGASVVLIDAAPVERLGGNARHGRNIRVANAHETPFQRDAYPAAEYAADLARIGCPDPALAQALAEGSADLADWLQAQGVRLEPWAAGNLPYSRRTVFLRGGGQALVNVLLRRAAGLGVVIRPRSTVTALDPALLDPGAPGPFAIALHTPTGAQTIRAQTVILACGGTGADLTAPMANRGTPEQLGAPLLWALAQGAQAAGRPGDGHVVAVDARAARHDAGIVSRVDGMHLGVVVGPDGRRFYDEARVTSPGRHSVLAREMTARPDPRAWIILGAAAVDALPPLLLPPIPAATPQALAQACGIDPAGLAESLHAALDPPRGAPVDLTPPLHAIPVVPGIGFTRHGLAIDPQGRVICADGRPAPRFFAVGTVSCGAVLGSGYLSGAGLSIAAVFGRAAGRAAAALAPKTKVPPQPLPNRAPPAAQPARVARAEATRALNICNTCGFCTALCAVFPAAQRRPALRPGDLRHLAHLCHDCRSCAYDCQYAPPHDLAVNLPATLAAARRREYKGEGRGAAPLFWALTLGLPVLALILLPWAALFGTHQGPGAFYAVVPHALMSGGAGAVFAWATLALLIRFALYWRAIRGPAAPVTWAAFKTGLLEAVTLRNLGDCEDRAGPVGQGRRIAHHLLAGGFVLTFFATVAGYLLHLSGQPAPYPWFSAPVVLGASGGVAMLAGLGHLHAARRRLDPTPTDPAMARADRFARAQLATLAGSGLLLLVLRDTPLMGLLLALHLGAVAGFALLLPFGKLAHGGFRLLSLIRHAAEEAGKLDKSRRPTP